MSTIDLDVAVKTFLVIYFATMLMEVLFSQWNKKKYYTMKDTLVNLSLGVIAVAFRFLTKGLWLALWIYLYQFAPYKISEGLLAWIILILGNEFVYYWFHRLSHENRFLWAVHVNHHSSEMMNISTAARVPFLNIILHNVFWIPLLFLGFDPTMIFIVETASFLFSFVQHTQVIGRLPIIDIVFNTPSHHRVHHASNPDYLNKNYGNVLIIFDRIFGTFKDEDPNRQTRYGLAHNIHTHNLIKVIFHEWIDLLRSRVKNSETKQIVK